MNEHAAVRPAQDTNTLGLVGFILSIVGLCSGGLLSPVGFIISLVALKDQPKGFAIAGAVIGGLGSCGILLSLLVIPLFLIGILVAAGATAAAVALAAAIGGPQLEAAVELQIIERMVERYQDEQGALPATLDDMFNRFNPSEGLRKDPWGHAYLFEPATDGASFRVFSAGPDGIPGNADDIDTRHSAGGTQPAFPAAPAEEETSETPQPTEPSSSDQQGGEPH